jgi:ketosteroid isomerase-like protein
MKAVAPRGILNPMSRQHLEVVRQWCDAVNRGELAAASDLFDSEIEFQYPDEFPGGGTYVGLESAGAALMQELEAWETFEMEIQEVEDLGDRVLAAIKERGKGRTSGALVEVVLFSVWTFSGGKVVRLHFFMNREEARHAAVSGARIRP